MTGLPINDGCTGCGACAQSCAKKAITICEDKEGFFIPKVDEEKCINCGLCEKRCHVLHKPQHDLSKQKTYAVINFKDRKVSSSGGAFSMMARYVLGKRGVVFGAAYEPSFPNVQHIAVECLEDLDRLRGSKYVQSRIGNAYKLVKDFLKQGRMVLFSGTPCQIGGLYAFLNGKRYDGQLITLDLVCHGVPNQTVFKTYLTKLEHSSKKISRKARNIVGFRFRNLDSWDYRPAVQISKPKNWLILDQEDNIYMSAFFSGSIYRESCFYCHYANCERMGTFTIADFWGIGKHGVKFQKNVASGISLVIDNDGILKSIQSELGDVYIEERTLEEALYENSNLKHPVERPKERDTAIMDMLNPDVTLLAYAQKYNMLEGTIKHFIKKNVKNIIYALGIYNVYKSLKYKLQ